MYFQETYFGGNLVDVSDILPLFLSACTFLSFVDTFAIAFGARAQAFAVVNPVNN